MHTMSILTLSVHQVASLCGMAVESTATSSKSLQQVNKAQRNMHLAIAFVTIATFTSHLSLGDGRPGPQHLRTTLVPLSTCVR